MAAPPPKRIRAGGDDCSSSPGHGANETRLSHLVAQYRHHGIPERTTASSGEAVCIEVRRLHRLPHVLLNYRELVPAHWGVTLLHGSRNAADLWASPRGSQLHQHLAKGTIRLMPLPAEYMFEDLEFSRHARITGLPPPAAFERTLWNLTRDDAEKARTRYKREEYFFHVASRRWYNQFLKTAEFWRMFTAEHVLLFEVDSILCPQPTLPLDWWAGRYGYIGSPWHPHMGAGGFWCRLMACCVGNSGLSLWNRPLILRLIETGELPLHKSLVYLWIATRLQDLAADGRLPVGLPAVPSEEIAFAFAVGDPADLWSWQVETVPVGVHGLNNWPTTRGQYWPSTRPANGPHGVTCPSQLSRHAYTRCVRLLERCPTILGISLNNSLNGERDDNPEWSALAPIDSPLRVSPRTLPVPRQPGT
jgi:hypothetical protein